MDPIEADLHGRTCLVTGATSGIGKEVARELARRGATVVMGCRSRERGEGVLREIVEETGNRAVEVLHVDVASQASVHAFTAEVEARHDVLHVLVNNAGIWAPRRQTSPDGIELTWATNMLGYFLVTARLLPLIQRSAPARIVSVASALARDLDLTDVQFERRPYDGLVAYAQSKQANRMWTWALARRLEGTGVTANAVHPGGVRTGIFRKGGGLKGALATAYMMAMGRTPAEGADTVVWAAASPEAARLHGRFLADRKDWPCRYHDPAIEERLWALCASMTATTAATPAPAGAAHG